MGKKCKTNRARIFVAPLANFELDLTPGRWIDADQTAEAIHAEIAVMLRQSPAQEWAIQDYEGFGSLHLSQSDSIDVVAAIGRGIEEYGILFAELASRLGGTSSAEDATRFMEERYLGKFTTLAEYAAEFFTERFGYILKQLPDTLTLHIDYDAIAHKMEENDEVITIQLHGKLHVFNANG